MHTPQVTRRGPNSFASELLQVSFGCPWGKCHFCNLYEHEDFGIVPMEHIVEDLDEIAATRRHPKSVLLLGGNPMGLPNSKLMPVLELIREKLPTVNGVSGFMSTAVIKRKSDDDLRAMAETGVTSVILGTESGRDETLARMEKGHAAADILENYPRLTAAGIKYSVFYLLGMAGAGNGADNALRSAEVYSQLVPTTITMTTLTPYKGPKLRREVEDGSFTLAGESEVMEEAALFIENLRCETTISGSHDSNLFKIDGILPRDREGMVATLRWRASNTDDAKMAGLRLKMAAM
ncbi:MAG: radical SAM protein [Eggerthellaceae bacterium]|nr:radical SAM protein [Eggerthellaceae bacterium]